MDKLLLKAPHVNITCTFCNTRNKQGGGKVQYYGKQSAVMVPVPKNVKKVAEYAFKLKDLGFKGGRETGWKRARQLATKDSIPLQDIKYMRAWFARHVYTSYPTYREWKHSGRPKGTEWHNKHGIIAWIIWGGDPAFNWINSNHVINLLNKHYNKDYTKIRIKK